MLHAILATKAIVRVVRGARAALDVIEHEAVELAVIDTELSDADVFDVCRLLRDARPGLPIVLKSPSRELALFDGALVAAIDDIFVQPYDAADLGKRIDKVLSFAVLAREQPALYELVRRHGIEQRRELAYREEWLALFMQELESPLYGIALLAQTALRDADTSPRLLRASSRIRDDAGALLREISNLRDLDGQLTPRPASIDVGQMLREIVTRYEARAAAISVSLSADVPPTSLLGDIGLLSRTFENLVANALRHAPEHSVVSLSVASRHAGVEIKVIDSGPGIPPRHRDRLFAKYALEATDGSRSSHGLGLAFCRRVVEAHRGRIWIEDGPGAVFCVWLPG